MRKMRRKNEAEDDKEDEAGRQRDARAKPERAQSEPRAKLKGKQSEARAAPERKQSESKTVTLSTLPPYNPSLRTPTPSKGTLPPISTHPVLPLQTPREQLGKKEKKKEKEKEMKREKEKERRGANKSEKLRVNLSGS